MSDGQAQPPAAPEPRDAKAEAAAARADAAAAKAYAKAQRNWFLRHWILTTIGVLVIVGIIAGIAGGGGSDDKAPTSSTSSKSPDAGDANSGKDSAKAEDASDDVPSFKNDVLTTEDLRIKITRYKVIPAGQKGNEYGSKPVIAFWYKVTNLSGAQTTADEAFIYNFDVYQDNNPNAENELDLALASVDDQFDDSDEDIKKGGTVESAISYELDDMTTPVDLVASEMFGSDIGKITYRLK